ncbi:hypothetical protein [Synechocystis sp. PCC 7509]|uniref:hypothetical protein n=1 Tax=Synechocystis sp. PCC 7509 TaxID=927677 RepID=UPI0002AC9B4C|nr:hypothetical protein [Synechocystis sp. PCC 7509]
MEEILNEYCKQINPGLLLLSMPTGFGKTYNVIKFIYSNYKEFAFQKRKIIFITNLKKNLPIEDLRKHFIANNNRDEFEDYVLFIDSNSQSVITNLTLIEDEIPEKFKTENYLRLKSYIEICKNSQLPQSVKSTLEKEIRGDIEPAFREFIKKTLNENFKTKKARLLAIKNNQEYQWIGKLYPAVFTDERTVLFLSMDKFITKNSTLVEPSYYFYERLINKSVIFIDEFDTTKESVLNNIIKSGLRHRVDLLDLFLNIHNHLMQNECPEGLLKESKWRKQKSAGKNWLSLGKQIESFRDKADRIFNTYKLQHTCKSHKNFSTNKRDFLFYDYQFHNVLDRHKRIEIIEDSQNRTNWIQAFDVKTKTVGIDIHSLLRDIAGFLTYFQTGIGYLAENYRHLKEEDDSIHEAFPLESAIKTVLNHFRLDSKDVEFLTSNIIEGDLPYGLRTDKGSIQRQGFYDTGFRYHDIVDSDEHDTLSKIYMFNFSRTPESFLAGVCSKAIVVGISATAGLYTNIGNYDLEYLKSRLGDSFIRLKHDTLVRLKNAYFEATKGYAQIKIKTNFIEVESQKEAIKKLESLLKDETAANHLWNTLQFKIDNEKPYKEFVFSRYVKVLTAWKYFLENYDCHAFICFFTKIPKLNDLDFDLNILYEYAELLLDGNKEFINDKVSETIVVLSGVEFEEKKAQILNDLKNNKRRFIISSYQTSGIGQNLQFPVPTDVKPIHINDFPKHEYMDINGIYLDNPTNLLVNISRASIEHENFIKYIFQLEFLVQNGAISLNTFRSKLDEAFKRYLGGSNKINHNFKNLYNTNAYSRYVNKIVIQAIGRICRTNMKASTIHILCDTLIRKHLTGLCLPEDVIPIREYAALLKSINSSTKQSEDLIEIQNRASNRSNQTSAYIRRQLSTPWTPQSVKAWQELREQVLIQPVVEKEAESNPKWNPIYLKVKQPASSYIYSQTEDYEDIEIFFCNEYGKKEVKEVSEKSAYLPNLMKIDILHNLFVDSGWATTFPESELMLTPPMFNNIYKGALGEVCGKYIFDKLLNINLLELQVDEFERFDFKTDTNIYIDFKFWNDRVAVQANDLISKIRTKMTTVRAERVFIINILGSSNTIFHPQISSDRKIIEVPYLCKNNKVDDEALEFIVKEL